MKKQKMFSLLLMFLFTFSIALGQTTAKETGVEEVFSIYLLSPNTSAARNQWSLLMEQLLPQIGIGISFHESTGWGNIAPRTWSYPFIDYDYIPSYEHGGYDLLFVGWSWPLDLNLQALYETSAITPNGDNHYQYSNPTYDALLDDYMSELDPEIRISLAYQLQAILYEDQPAIPIVYPRSLFGFEDGLTGIDTLLIASGGHRIENWDDPSDHIIKYAVPADLKEWNTYVQESFYDGQWMQCVYGSVVQRAVDSHVWEPQSALDFSVSDVINDKINVTVNLDPDMKFSDGSTVLPEDVKYSYQLHMTPAVGSSQYGILTHWFASNDSIEITDPSAGGQIVFKFDAVFNLWDSILYNAIIDKSEVEPLISTYGYSIFNEIPGTGNVGWSLVKSCGPMMVDSFDSVNSIVKLIPNPYWSDSAASGGADPLLDEFYLTFISGKDTAVAELISGNIDITDAQYFPSITDFTSPGVEGVLVKDPSHQEMSINMLHPYLGTGELTPLGTPEAAKNIRKAISHACPRDIIVDQILEGLGAPATTAIPDCVVGYDDSLEPYVYDLDLAREYMELAGFDIMTDETGIPGIVLLAFLGLATVEFVRRKFRN